MKRGFADLLLVFGLNRGVMGWEIAGLYVAIVAKKKNQ